MRLIFTCLLFLSFFFARSQEELQYHNRFGLSLFKIELNRETMHDRFEPKLIYGVYYERLFSRKISWISLVEYGENIINDNCIGCADHFYGKGQMTEFNATSGIKYTINGCSQSRLKLFAELDISYSWLNYSGHFDGGWTGSGTVFDNSYKTIVGIGRVGINYFPHPRFVITASSSCHIGKTWWVNKYGGGSYSGGITDSSILELRFGFLF